ncbi:hypothetical protein BN131_3819 [Cronobacter malonaticus 681]|nr:hypothetical protein BN131_3819 [Cronobacter malonaticus 681]
MIQRRTRGFDLFRRYNGFRLVHRSCFLCRDIRLWRSVRRLRCRIIRFRDRRIRFWRRCMRLGRILCSVRLRIRIVRWLLIRPGVRLLRLMRLLRRLMISGLYRRAALRGLPVLFFLQRRLRDRRLRVVVRLRRDTRVRLRGGRRGMPFYFRRDVRCLNAYRFRRHCRLRRGPDRRNRCSSRGNGGRVGNRMAVQQRIVLIIKRIRLSDFMAGEQYVIGIGRRAAHAILHLVSVIHTLARKKRGVGFTGNGVAEFVRQPLATG